MSISSGRVLTSAAVVYYSELSMVKAFLVSMSEAAGGLFSALGVRTCLHVIDNSESAQYFSSIEAVCREFLPCDAFELHLINSMGNLGYGGGNNKVLEGLSSDYHLIVNPDVVVQQDTLLQAVDYLDRNGQVCMVSPQVIEVDGAVHHVVKAYPDCLTLALRYLGSAYLNVKFSKRLGRYQRVDLIDQVDGDIELAGGCFQFMRTEVLKRLGGFDDRFFMYFEDYDLSIRAKAFGRLAYVPSVKISHAGGDVGRKNWRHHLFFCSSAWRFFNKHQWRFW